MRKPTKQAQRFIAALAAKHGLNLEDSKLNNREVRVHTLYAGGGHLRELLNGVTFCFAQCGSKGEWAAILPADRLMQLLEADVLHTR